MINKNKTILLDYYNIFRQTGTKCYIFNIAKKHWFTRTNMNGLSLKDDLTMKSI